MQPSKLSYTNLATLLCGVMISHGAGCSQAAESAAPPAQPGAFAVVELFTSEGCSSCPPADVVLADIATDARQRETNVYPIEFHIDYWDSLGWRDPFSLPLATQRQQHYAAVLDTQVYTPQMVINGRTQLIGSDRDTAIQTIANELGKSPKSKLVLSDPKISGSDVAVTYATANAPAGSVLNLVLVQQAATTEVLRGENAGRKLEHHNIARSFQSISLRDGGGKMILNVPAGLDKHAAAIVGFIQNPDTLQILGAARVDIVSK